MADPVVQAGERILFVTKGNQVTAHVQIKFQGEASDFGWLVPVPAVPVVKTGTDELFEVLDETTRPSFVLNTSVHPNCRPSSPISIGCGAGASVSRGGEATPVGNDPLVLRDTAGPYDYAVLKADSKADVQSWLNTNRFFVPTTSDAALMPYIRPGAYFLALKLKAGAGTRDLRPIVLQYTSDYPMIPLILTSATAVPNMGVQVFVLGAHRAIPRNYHHVELNLLKLDWATAANYQALVTQAVGEAPERHAFVTEYAGPSSIARGQLVSDHRFGFKVDLAASATPAAFVSYLYQHGYPKRGTSDLSESLMSVLETQLPYPTALPVSRQEFFRNAAMYLSTETQQQHPEWYAGWPGTGSFDAATLTEAVWAEAAQPALDAEEAIRLNGYLTRMFTTLSPEDMTKDPVFATNSMLSQVPAQRIAGRQTGCSGQPSTFATSGYQVEDESKLTEAKKAEMPAAARIEQLNEEGAATEVSRYELDGSFNANLAKCAIADGAFMAGLAALWLVIRRRKIP